MDPTETRRRTAGETFAREVVAEMLRMRGWDPKTAEKEVRDDVFNTLHRHSMLYTYCFLEAMEPQDAAVLIQHWEWAATT